MSRAAHRYAQAIFQSSLETDIRQKAFEEMQVVYNTIEDSRELQAVLQSPVIKADEKEKVLLEIFKDQNGITHKLIRLLTANKRTPLLGRIAKGFIDLYNEQQGVKTALATTAVPLTPELEEKITAKVKELTGSEKIILENKTDSEIIGGFILRVDDMQYDASISNQLRRLNRALKNQYN